MARPNPVPPSALHPNPLTPTDAATRRDLADLGGTLQRRARARARIGLPGGAPCPPFLQRAEADAPGAARLYVSLDGERFTAERAVEVGSYLEMDRAAVVAALDALRRSELIGDGAHGSVTLTPGGGPN